MFAKPRPKKSPLPPAPSKKRKAVHAIEEISFDNSARAEYLTGFHKRKVQRQKHAQMEAAKKEREEKIEMRKQIRDERKQAVEDHVKNIEDMLKKSQVAGLGSDEEAGSGSDEEEWTGIEDAAPSAPTAPTLEPVDHEEEYIDEDIYTTVKVEAVSIDRDGLHNKAELEAEDGDDGDEAASKKSRSAEEDKKKAKKEYPKKKKKFRYESKFDRQKTNRKNKAKKAGW
ncbi:nucleolar protein 12-domain-containing protein [Coniella lustricola]|uniref:Nucleolar protein 12-domain-containing protein n=1 Tax=Coniella lustricola TaxID=2025994 RepID=A0A2T3AL13_9PEZI|nr:nucleolar protein 12-domain-containing protein [Coniella lustricola]